jgi:hypothetical protein
MNIFKTKIIENIFFCVVFMCRFVENLTITLKFKPMKTVTINGKKLEVLNSYSLKENESIVCIENFEGYSYKVYALYVNGEYEKRIYISK